MKKELQEEYEKYKAINSADGYSKAVVTAGESVMKALDDGETPEKAIKTLETSNLTMFMAGAAIQAVVHFHERGEEVRVYWNKKYGSEAKKGVVNPAIMTFKGKK
jgi:hypothetical protein